MNALTDEERVLNRARALMQNRGMKRGDALAAAAETLRRDTPAARTPVRPPSHALASFPSRAQIEAAGDLDWEPKPQAAQQVTISAVVDGFTIEVKTVLSEVRGALRQLRELGAMSVVTRK
jgi:hypothetical protein